MRWEEFTSIPDGTRVHNNEFDQCVALANLYWTDVVGLPLPRGIASAHQWWNDRASKPVLNEHATFSGTPTPGALFVAREGMYNTPDGHIGVVTSVNADGTFNTMEQNAEKQRYVGRYTRGMRNVLGFIIPRDNPANPAQRQPQGEEDMAYLITTDRGEILVVDHNQMTYWNVHKGIPFELVDLRMTWLKNQGAIREVAGLQPAALLSGYSEVGAPAGTVGTVEIDDADLKAIAKAVNDEAAERLKQ